MTTTSIHTILQQGEGLYAEFKTSFNEDVIETLVAFANAGGGSVYIGVADNGSVKGLLVGRETIQNWVNEVKNKTAMMVVPEAELINVDDKTIVRMSVTEFPVKPVSFRGRYYKRISASNHLMGVDEIANEHLMTLNTSWDYYLDPHHTIDDISEEKVIRFIQRVEKQTQREIGLSASAFLRKYEMVRDNKITFGAYLMFAKDYCSISDIQVGRFKSDITIIDSETLHTDLFTEVDSIIAFIRKHMMVEYIITGELQRTERFDYPPEAVREIVLNMIVHRDYRESSASIIKIFDDRIEFFNPGKLYGGITIDNLLTGNYSSKSRNKLIARAFKEIGLIERFGSGIMRILQICKDYGVKAPHFAEIHNGFNVTLYKEKLNSGYQPASDYPEVMKEPLNGDEGLNEGLSEGLSEGLKLVLELISKHPGIQAKEICSTLNDRSIKTIERQIGRLRKLELIERSGSRKTGGYIVKPAVSGK